MVKLVLFIILMLLALFIKRSRFVTLTIFFFLSWLTYISTNIADNSAYQNIYQIIGIGQKYTVTGYGWWFLCQLGNELSLNFMAFKAIIFFIGLLLIWITIWRLHINDNFIIAAYLIYPVLTDIIQIRFFLGSSIVIFFMYYLWKKGSTIYGYLIYITGVILAGQIHNAMYFFLIFVVWKIIYKHKKVSACLSGLILLFFIIDKSMFVSVITIFGNDQENQFYLNSQYSTSILHTISYIFTTLLFSYVSIMAVKYDVGYLTNESDYANTISNYLSFMCVVNCLSVFIVLMGSYAFTFLRLQKPLWILNYLEVAILASNYKSNQKLDPRLLKIVYLILAIVWLLNSEQQAISDFFFVN